MCIYATAYVLWLACEICLFSVGKWWVGAGAGSRDNGQNWQNFMNLQLFSPCGDQQLPKLVMQFPKLMFGFPNSLKLHNYALLFTLWDTCLSAEVYRHIAMTHYRQIQFAVNVSIVVLSVAVHSLWLPLMAPYGWLLQAFVVQRNVVDFNPLYEQVNLLFWNIKHGLPFSVFPSIFFIF